MYGGSTSCDAQCQFMLHVRCHAERLFLKTCNGNDSLTLLAIYIIFKNIFFASKNDIVRLAKHDFQESSRMKWDLNIRYHWLTKSTGA